MALPAIVVALAVPVVAVAAGPDYQGRGSVTGVDGDFCGSGKPVTYDTRYTNSVWVVQSGAEEATLKVTFNFRAVLSANGRSVIDSGAGSQILPITMGLEDGEHTHLLTDHGLRSKLQLPNGGVLTRDAGTLEYTLTFDANDNVIDFQFISMNGPHPDFESDTWCTAAIEALGF